jgi:hypothetical protein
MRRESLSRLPEFLQAKCLSIYAMVTTTKNAAGMEEQQKVYSNNWEAAGEEITGKA